MEQIIVYVFSYIYHMRVFSGNLKWCNSAVIVRSTLCFELHSCVFKETPKHNIVAGGRITNGRNPTYEIDKIMSLTICRNSLISSQ